MARRTQQAGFTLIESMVAMAFVMLAFVGILRLVTSNAQTSALSRHATEAAVLAEDKMEALRTIASASLGTGSEIVDATGRASSTGLYTRSWFVTNVGTSVAIAVTIAWSERGESRSVILRGQRGL